MSEQPLKYYQNADFKNYSDVCETRNPNQPESDKLIP